MSNNCNVPIHARILNILTGINSVLWPASNNTAEKIAEDSYKKMCEIYYTYLKYGALVNPGPEEAEVKHFTTSINSVKPISNTDLRPYYDDLYKTLYSFKIFQEALRDGSTSDPISVHYSHFKQLIENGYQTLLRDMLNRDCPNYVDAPRGAMHSFMYDLQDYNLHINNITQKIIPKILKDFIVFRTHVFNCMLRRVEGYFINQSLLQMKTTLTQYLVYSMSRKYGNMSNGPQVLFYE